MLEDRVSMSLRRADHTLLDAFDSIDEAAHRPTDDENWQESVALAWHDLEQNIGGFIRIGRTPNRNGGYSSLWSSLHAPGLEHGMSRTFALDGDNAAGPTMGAGRVGGYTVTDKGTRWTLVDANFSYEVLCRPLHEPLPLWPRSGRATSDIATEHFETSGTIEGTVTVRDATYVVSGLAHGDHSWGPRRWDARKTHRWVNGVFGEDLSFCVLTYHGRPARIARYGYLIVDGLLHYSDQIDVVTWMEADGATHRGGQVQIRLADGRTFDFTARPLCKGFYAYEQSSAIFESPCEITYGDRVGYGDFEISENCRQGSGRPSELVNGLEHDGSFFSGPGGPPS